MKLVFKKGDAETAPKEYACVRVTEELKGTKRLVKEGGREALELGAGKYADMNARKFILLMRAMVQAAKANKSKKIAIPFDDTIRLFKNLNESLENLIQCAAENFEMANFEFNHFKTRPEEGWDVVEEILLYGKFSSGIEKAMQKGQEIGRAVNACRTLANKTGGDMTPTLLAKAAKKARPESAPPKGLKSKGVWYQTE